jgi:DNA-binding SARP family transcriptional activator
MRRVHLSLLGGFEARLEPGPTLTMRTRKNEALLAYLALHPGRIHRRESLAAMLWGGASEEQARGSLRHALYELRRVLAGASSVL